MTADTVGGVWTYSLALARALSALSIEVELAVMGPAPSPAQMQDAAGIRIFLGPYRLEWMESPWEDVDSAGRWLLELEASRNPDLIHLNGYVHASLPFSAPVVIAAHSCVVSWWRAVHNQPPPAEWNTYRERVAAGIHAAGAVVAISKTMSQTLRDEYGRAADRVIYNCLPRPSNNIATIRRRAVFCAGRFWDRAKNLQLIGQAAAAIDAEIFAAGDGWECDHIWSLGHLSQDSMHDWYRQCEVFCHPVLYEPFGLAPLEAALNGCALVLADVPSLREIWGDAALFVSPHEPTELAQNVNKLLNDSHLRNLYVQRALERARCFTVERQSREYEQIYESVLVPSGRERALQAK